MDFWFCLVLCSDIELRSECFASLDYLFPMVRLVKLELFVVIFKGLLSLKTVKFIIFGEVGSTVLQWRLEINCTRDINFQITHSFDHYHGIEHREPKIRMSISSMIHKLCKYGAVSTLEQYGIISIVLDSSLQSASNKLIALFMIDWVLLLFGTTVKIFQGDR